MEKAFNFLFLDSLVLLLALWDDLGADYFHEGCSRSLEKKDEERLACGSVDDILGILVTNRS